MTPVIAVFLTLLFGGLMFGLLLGDFPSAFGAIKLIFWDPLFDEKFASYARPQLLVKAGPIILIACLLYTSPSPRDLYRSRMPSSA